MCARVICACVRVHTYLRHDAVGARALLVLEHDVGVVVDDEVLELGVSAGDASLGEPRRAQRVLRHVRHVLLEDERRHLAAAVRRAVPAARATPRGARGRGERQQQPDGAVGGEQARRGTTA